MTRQHIVFLTGAGISVDIGLSTFRGKDGLWTNEEWVYLASTEALYNDTQRCLDFYNWRRKQLSEVNHGDGSLIHFSSGRLLRPFCGKSGIADREFSTSCCG